ncbi:multidrug efflux SMR transporter [Bdellovibrio sp. NC01]|uniref:DMT family transporter n=1 Tax=Bdellovibrio sp. NC01 TaxID=2220073 RepID=UPI001158FB8D|nr:multidrug efflux SMR transporter [Bdellovibrio sp. NC01]QDK37592.1 QacE family quaternary ammonium compound efflux SMR transporter [Bdellovibrio sp. NC01]
MAYVYLAAAIIFEILGTISMKYAEGFTKVVPSVLIFVCYGICFVALTVALKTLPVSMVYAIWAGVGTAIMAVVGLFFFNEPLPLQKIMATSLIILGVVMLNFSGKHSQETKEQIAEVENVQELKRIPAADVKTPNVEIPQRAPLANRNSG